MIPDESVTTIARARMKFLRDQVAEFTRTLWNDVINPLIKMMGLETRPQTLEEFRRHLEILLSSIDTTLTARDFTFNEDDRLEIGPSESLPLPPGFPPMVKRVILDRRRATESAIDQLLVKTTNQEVIDILNQKLATFDWFLNQDWLVSVQAPRTPRLADYVTFEQVALIQQNIQLVARQFDEKFHLLQAPDVLFPDIAYYRELNTIRDNALAVAFIDIDDFKKLNTRHGHAAVDSSVLPVFMRELERFAFGRGHAYRIGGDEYVILLVNAKGCRSALAELQGSVLDLRYAGVEERTAITIGLCEVPSDCFLSDRKVYERANRAMCYAKDNGKGHIASYAGSFYRDNDLFLLKPPLEDHGC